MAQPFSRGLEALFARSAVFGTALASTAIAVMALADILDRHGLMAWEWVLLGHFALLFLWIAISFWSALAGFVALLTGWRAPGLSWPGQARPLQSRTAILLPIYNENLKSVAGNLRAMYEGLAASGEGECFDFFLLSDSTDPAVWVSEEAAWYQLSRELKGAGRIYYRHRSKNTARKAGNIADFCRRWGGRYDHMLVLDADSLMAPASIIGLARLMEENPRAGLLQVPPVLIGRDSLFARLQQFAAGLSIPLLSRSLAFWQLSDGNYWGHNAIIRVEAFMESCGLPKLPGRAPLGGEILSHDFVEAALLRRAGWEVWMVPELGGSYEESPPHVIAYAARDRRWCQGNLQHALVLPARGLKVVSRIHLAMGVFSYLASPLWLAFLLLGIAVGVAEEVEGTLYFPGDQPFPVLPGREIDNAAALFLVALAMLLAPKLLSLLALWLDGRSARLFGGRLLSGASLLLELLLSALVAPAMMLFHSRAVWEVLTGRDGGWDAQDRGEGGLPFRRALAAHGWHLAGGGALLALAPMLPDGLLWWFSPIFAGLLTAPLITWATAKPGLGRWARRRGLLLIPEETAPPAIVRRARVLARRPLPPIPESGLAAVLSDPRLLALHRALLTGAMEPQPDQRLVARALRHWRRGEPLSRPEEAALLGDLAALGRLVMAARAGVRAERKPLPAAA